MSNIFINQNINISNQEIIQSLGLDKDTTDLDKAAFDAVEENNVMAYIQEGLTEENARIKAKQMRSLAMSNSRRKSKLSLNFEDKSSNPLNSAMT